MSLHIGFLRVLKITRYPTAAIRQVIFSSQSSVGDNGSAEDLYFVVAAANDSTTFQPAEMDVVWSRCRELRQLLRARPTLPLKVDGEELTVDDLNVGYRLPLYSCPFQCIDGSGCNFRADDCAAFIHHIAGGVGDIIRLPRFMAVACRGSLGWITRWAPCL